jgi:hypothetical protein
MNLFDIEGMAPVDPKSLEEFARAMREEVIPAIVEIQKQRQIAAAEARNWIIC